jgi:tetratricopeptide (TPR) repeat protein
MNFFFASHWQSKADAVKHRDYLEKALGEDASDVDVLIACYRLPHPAPAFREKIRQLIRAAGDEVRSKISEEPESATNYNQLAWLIANTEGDFDEALRLSRKSLELSPDTGGYYDTLGRVYFARGDLENAVKSQTRAVELDPHSGLIQRQLELFRKKLEEKKQQPAAKG